jgi:hypothetical protein
VFDCGVCGGDGSGCTPPELFSFNHSTNQAFYYFYSVTINGIAVEPDDWVGAFNGDVCVGSRRWDTSGYCSDGQYTDEATCINASEGWTWNLCLGGFCDLPVMGDDGNDFTDGYMINGGIPSFKIFDASENIYYDAMASEDIGWENFNFSLIESLTASQAVFGCTDDSACNYDETATEDDGSCAYEIDCAGECGGDAVEDNCGDCDNDPENDCVSPEEFLFNQSSSQAFYFVMSATDIYTAPLDSGDWIGLFNGEICVGAREWPGEAVDVPAMGETDYDGDGIADPWTEGYLLEGDMPSYRIYDASEDMIYTAFQQVSFSPRVSYAIPIIIRFTHGWYIYRLTGPFSGAYAYFTIK